MIANGRALVSASIDAGYLAPRTTDAPGPSENDDCPPRLGLDFHGRCISDADAAAAAETLLGEARRQQGDEGLPLGVQVW